MKKKKYKTIGIIELCPKCGDVMERRTHSFLTPKQLTQPYIFAYWDYCPHCKYLKHYEMCKIEIRKYNKKKPNKKLWEEQ